MIGLEGSFDLEQLGDSFAGLFGVEDAVDSLFDCLSGLVVAH